MTTTEPGRALIESGFGIAGSMTGSAATVVYAPDDAALQLDDRFAACLRGLADDLADGGLPRRERARAGAALAFAVEHGVSLSRRDRHVRADGFFTERAGGRVAAREVGEGVLLAARSSAEERRVRHLGYLFAEVVCSPDVDAALADRTLLLTRSLTWRQLALLAAVGRRERAPLPLTPLPADPRAWVTWGALEDLVELQRAGLLDPPVAVPRPGGAAQPRLRPADLRLTRRGVLVHRLLALDFVHPDDVDAALAALG
ncbi:hypothetical protein [Klenkia taihuensis]|uniref:Uncharacterized protein n=1 Tax=Klenkia taihuensis TaxID=1225127 RepID=A0A1I1TJ02_9ACTN|nr:hypothetical protein [Klenkia taihuensis]GHE12746.1 hypothetical protein GCM10011381_31790 [Klenkia taihuensis]SFD58592.1 hypothetical protein SAMN05661030_3795 [Klenkia taihuensis]